MAQPAFKGYVVTAPDGKTYDVNAPEGTSEEELYEYVQQTHYNGQTPVAPNAITDASREQTVATKAWEEVPGAREYAEEQFFKTGDFGETQRGLAQKFGVNLPNEMVGTWQENLAFSKTPQGRNFFANNSPFAPINRPTGVEDVAAPDSVIEEAVRGVERGIYGMANTYRKFGAMGADLVGADETAQQWLDDSLEQDAALELNLPSGAPSVSDVDSLGDAGMIVAATLGELAPNLAGSFGAAAIGGLIAKKGASAAARELVESAAERGIAREVAEAEAAALVQRATLRGGIAGASAQGISQEQGEAYGTTYARTGEMSPWQSAGVGAVAGLLDTLMPADVLRRVGGPAATEALSAAMVKRVGAGAARTILLEAGPEGLQSILTQLPSGEIDWEDVANSIVRGGIAGSVVGGSVGAYEAVRDNKANPPTPEVRSSVPEGAAPIAVPTVAGRTTKAYKEQIETTRQEIDTRARSLTSTWENAPEIEVHQNFSKLKGVANNAVGVYAGGKLMINTEQVLKAAKEQKVSPDDVVSAVTYHEGLGHHGLELEFGQALDDKLAQILASSTLYQQKVAKWIKKNPKAYEGDPNQDVRALEEIMAEQANSGVKTTTFTNIVKNTVKEFGRRMGLDLQYSTREVDTIVAMSHAAVISGKGRSARDNGFKFMFIGRGADLTDKQSLRLEFAENLLASGRDPEQVRKATGWHRAPDGQMRFEISDKDAQLIDKNFNRLASKHEDMSLGNVLKHTKLFEAYPELNEIRVGRKIAEDTMKLEPDELGFYDNENQLIYVRSSLKDKTALSVLLHEIQHAVQDQEGFASGGSPATVLDVISNEGLVKGSKQFIKWLKAKKNLSEDEAIARDVAIEQIKEQIETGQYDSLRSFFNAEHEFMAGARREAYNHLFGEVEARDVQARMYSDEKELQEWEPYTSEPDLDPESYIFDMEGEGGPSQAPVIVNKYMMLTSPDKVDMTPEEIEQMSDEEIFESENALTFLEKIVDGYTPVHLPMDELLKEVELRGFTPGELLRSKTIEPGELTKKLFMYDIAASKLQDKVTTLFEKMQNGTASASDMANHAKALYQMHDITQKIFDVQGELGRALNAMKMVNFSQRRVKGVMETVAQFQRNSPFDVLNNPDDYYKFAMDIQAQIEAGKEKLQKDGKTWAANALNLPRALMSTLDMSAPLRQGLFLIHRPEWWRSFGNMFRYYGDKQAYKDLMDDITSRNTYGLMVGSNLAITNIDGKLSQREEDYQTEWAQKIPGFGRLVRASERAYNGFLNKLRADVFDDMVSKLPDGYSSDDLKSIARFINAATGRGNLHKSLQSSAPLLNAMLFSPRLMSSRLTMLTDIVRPATYMKMNPVARKEYFKSLLSVGTLAMTILGLAALGGAEVEKDPRSTDFAKIKIGNTRYDILGGSAQYITLAARISTNSVKTADDYIKTYGKGFGAKSAFDATLQFLRNKLAPIPSFMADALDRKDAVGRPFELDRALVQRMVPMIATNIYENAEEIGYAQASLMAIPEFFGVGANNYQSYSLDTNRELDPPDHFKMKEAVNGEYANATVSEGTVRLDDAAQKEWGERINFYYKEWLAEEMAKPEWKTMNDDQKKATIKAVRDDARKEARADMLEVLEIPTSE